MGMIVTTQGSSAHLPMNLWSLERIGFWVIQLCLNSGTEPETAFQVAACFVRGIRQHRLSLRKNEED